MKGFEEMIDGGTADLLTATRRGEFVRACCQNAVAQTLTGGLALLVALSYYQASNTAKGLLAGGVHAGFMLTPVFLLLLGRLGWRITTALAVYLWVAAGGLVAAACSWNVPSYIGSLLVVFVCFAATAPLVTALWRQNAPASSRGRSFSIIISYGALAALLAGFAVKAIIAADLERFRGIYLTCSGLLLIAGFVVWRIPSQPLERKAGRNPLAPLALLWRHKLFGYISLAWMFLGLGNLATIPLRVEFAASPDLGLGLGPDEVLLVTMILPELLALLSMFVWGRLFDRMNFMLLRMSINAFFIASIPLFFWGNWPCMLIGALLFGIGRGGGSVAWSLWVTKFSPPEKTADYMTAHAFLTGTRGLFGPIAAYAVLDGLGLYSITWSCVAMMTLATLMLLPIVHLGRR